MKRYRVVTPMLAQAAFRETVKRGAVPTYYQNDIVFGIDQRDADRLASEGFLELLPDEEPAAG